MKSARLVSFGFVAALAVVLAGCSSEDNAQIDSGVHAPKRALDMAKGVETDSNISQINQALGMARGDNEGKSPATLEEAKKVARVPESMWTDAATGKPLVYDPATGRVSKAP